MSRIKPIFVILGLVIALGLIAAACGEESSPTPVPEVAETTAPADEPTAVMTPDAEPTATMAPTATAAAEVSALPPGVASLVEGMPVCEGAQDAMSGGTLRTFGYEPGTWDVQGGDWWTAGSIQTFTHLRLTQWNFCNPGENSDYTVYPYLAKSWDISDDGLQYTFHIREGVKWENKPPVNGREITADDVAFSFDRFLQPEAYNGSLLGPVESVVALDKYTVQFTLSEPYAGFLPSTAYGAFPIYAPEVLAEFGGFDTAEANIGAGPWMLAEYEPEVRMVLERNPDFFRGANGITGENLPYMDGTEFLFIYDIAPGLAMYRARDVDTPPGLCACFGYWTGDLEMISNLRETDPDLVQDVRHFTDTPNAIWYLRPKVDRPPFDNQKLRQAVSMVVGRDCESWCRTWGIEDENRELSSNHPWFVSWEELGEGQRFYPRDAEGNAIRDVEGAIALANEARAEMGLEPDEIIHTTIYTDGSSSDMELFKTWLADINIEADIVSMEYTEFAAEIQNYPFEWDGIAYSVRDPPPWDVDARLSPDFLPDGSFNNMGVDDPVLTEMVLAQRSETDQAVREQIVRDIQKYLAVQQYEWIIPNYLTQNIYPPWLRNVGPQKSVAAQGDSFLQAWLTDEAPSRQ